MKSTWFSLLVVIAAIIAAYGFAGGAGSMLMGLYGVGIAAVGMLATLGITLATDAYGPIADNAGGNAEMTHQAPEVRQRTDALDSLGNTTAAMGKGFAIGSAALTALALLAAYVEEVRIGQVREGQAAIVMHCGNDVIVGQAAHCGAKKVAVVSDVRSDDDGNAVMKSETFMVMSTLPKGFDIGEIEVAWATEANGDNVREATLVHKTAMAKDKDGVETGPLTIAEAQLVPVEKATLRQYMDFYGVNLMNPKVLCGLFAGVLLVFLFSAMTMKAVGKAAMAMVKEVRRQFRDIPGIMEGTGEPDYAKCVSISTAGAQKAMIIPSMLALVVPILVGLVLDVGGVLGLLAGGLTCGFAMAIFMANAGGSWDNAKKYIETGKHGGKGSDAHKAAVVGDTVGDPFKDTSGPSLNILIKLMSMVSVVFAGLVVKYAPIIGAWIGLD
jgi:inorganic pyrophosphatase/K(+)-stimulated pyrophosphate-energized sodium pump